MNDFTFDPKTAQLAGEAFRAIQKRFAPSPHTEQGQVTAVRVAKPENGGQVIDAQVRLVNGTIVNNVTAYGFPIQVGTTVDLRGDGGLIGGNWSIHRIRNTAPGAASSDPHAILSTPNIAYATTRIEQAPNGNQQVVIDFVVECIVEQWRGRVPVRYEVELYDEALQMVDQLVSAQLEKVGGKITSTMTMTADSATVYKLGGANPPTFQFPVPGMFRVENELIYYKSAGYNGTTQSWLLGIFNRGFAGTSPAVHTAPREVVLAGLVVSTNALIPNAVYKARVRAKAADGRISNWGDLVTVIATYDTTSPSWTTPVVLTVTSANTGFLVQWTSADTDILDLDHYNIQVSTDGVTYGPTRYNAGNGNSWLFPGTAGQIRRFRIQAVDRAGNAGYQTTPSYVAWSAGVRGYLLPSNEPQGDNLVVNPTAVTNTANWTSGGLFSPTFSRSTTVYLGAVGSFQLSWTRFATGDANANSDKFAVESGGRLYVRLFARGSNVAGVSDIFRVTVRWYNAGGTQLSTSQRAIKASQLTTTEWDLFTFDAFAPIAATQADVQVAVATASGSGTATINFDAVYVVQYTQGTQRFLSESDYNGGYLDGSKTWDPPLLASGAATSTTVTVTGAVPGDGVGNIGFTGLSGQQVNLQAVVYANDTVYVRLTNLTGANLDLPSGTLKVRVQKLP